MKRLLGNAGILATVLAFLVLSEAGVLAATYTLFVPSSYSALAVGTLVGGNLRGIRIDDPAGFSDSASAFKDDGRYASRGWWQTDLGTRFSGFKGDSLEGEIRRVELVVDARGNGGLFVTVREGSGRTPLQGDEGLYPDWRRYSWFLSATSVERVRSACAAGKEPFEGWSVDIGITANCDLEWVGLRVYCTPLVCEPPETPLGVECYNFRHGESAAIDWEPVPGATLYRVYRSADEAGPYLPIGERSGGTDFADTTGAPCRSYYYKVQAVNDCGESDLSAAVEGHRVDPPAVPVDVSATDGLYCDRVEVTWNVAEIETWDPFTEPEYFEVRRAIEPSGPYELLGATTSTAFDDLTADRSVAYHYRVAAMGESEACRSAESDANEGCLWGATAAPNPQATDQDYTDKIALTWSAVDLATDYVISRSIAPEDGYEKIAVIPAVPESGSGPSFDDTEVLPGVVYWYRVQARHADCGAAEPSTPDSGVRRLEAPTEVTASDLLLVGAVDVGWTPVEGATSYDVLRREEAAEEYDVIATVEAAECSDESAAPCTTYLYAVRASSPDSESEISEEDAGSPLVHLSPAGVRVTEDESLDYVGVSWERVPGAERYEIHRSSSADGEYTSIAVVEDDPADASTTSNYRDYDAASCTAYWYKVRATSACAGRFSEPERGARASHIAPVGVVATDLLYADRVEVTWSAIEDVSEYRILRGESPDGAYVEVGRTDLDGDVGSPIYADSTASPCTHFWYAVQAVDDCGVGLRSSPDEGSVLGTYYRDGDGDGYGVTEDFVYTCEPDLDTEYTTPLPGDECDANPELVKQNVCWVDTDGDGVTDSYKYSSSKKKYLSCESCITQPSAHPDCSVNDPDRWRWISCRDHSQVWTSYRCHPYECNCKYFLGMKYDCQTCYNDVCYHCRCTYRTHTVCVGDGGCPTYYDPVCDCPD